MKIGIGIWGCSGHFSLESRWTCDNLSVKQSKLKLNLTMMKQYFPKSSELFFSCTWKGWNSESTHHDRANFFKKSIYLLFYLRTMNLFVFLPKQNEFICFIKKITGYLQRKLQKSPKYIDLPCENILSFSWVKFMHWLKSVNGKRTKTSRKQVRWVWKQNRSNKLKSAQKATAIVSPAIWSWSG